MKNTSASLLAVTTGAFMFLLCSTGGVLYGGDETTHYSIEHISIPEGVTGETDGLTFTPDERLVAAFHEGGQIYMYDPETEEWSLFAEGLHEPMGIYAPKNNELVVVQRPEITRIRDTDGDGFADEYNTISDDYGMSGNYHEFAFGPAVGSDGQFFMSLNTASNMAGIADEIRGEFRKTGRPGRMYSCVPHRGWVLRVSPDGETTPWALGFRSPNGIGFDSEGRLFVTDNQGDWLGTSRLYHVKKGHFYGHPSSLVWKPGFEGNPLDLPVKKLNSMRTRPVVRFPHGLMANSPTEIVEDTTGGEFGPFAGQLIIGEMNFPRIMRVMLDRVAGSLQGACVSLINRSELNIGNHRLVFGPNDNLWVGHTVRKKGWAGSEGITRISWKGTTPMDVRKMELTENGFDLTFTKSVDAGTIRKEGASRFKRFYYEYHRQYGSKRYDRTSVPVNDVSLRNNGKTIRFVLAELKPGYIYSVSLDGIQSRTGQPVSNPNVYYTLNRLTDGTTDTPQFKD